MVHGCGLWLVSLVVSMEVSCWSLWLVSLVVSREVSREACTVWPGPC